MAGVLAGWPARHFDDVSLTLPHGPFRNPSATAPFPTTSEMMSDAAWRSRQALEDAMSVLKEYEFTMPLTDFVSEQLTRAATVADDVSTVCSVRLVMLVCLPAPVEVPLRLCTVNLCLRSLPPTVADVRGCLLLGVRRRQAFGVEFRRTHGH